jgi:hypothetical protein
MHTLVKKGVVIKRQSSIMELYSMMDTPRSGSARPRQPQREP